MDATPDDRHGAVARRPCGRAILVGLHPRHHAATRRSARTLEQVDTARRIVDAYPHHLQRASTADELVRIHRSGKVGSLLGIEGGRQIGGSMAALRRFHDLGVRYMTLTHNQTTEWADAATDEPKHDGLSPFGLEVVREMNRLGMLVDLSHVSPATMKDAIRASRAPVIFSHSDAFALNPHPRNVSDDVLRMLPANGGVMMVTFVPGFLSAENWAWARERSAEEARLKSSTRSARRVTAGLKAWEAAHPQPPVTVSAVADHIEHVARVAGHDHVGLGGDFDGISSTVSGLNGVEDYPNIFAELIRREWSDENLSKLAGGNVLRVLRRRGPGRLHEERARVHGQAGIAQMSEPPPRPQLFRLRRSTRIAPCFGARRRCAAPSWTRVVTCPGSRLRSRRMEDDREDPAHPRSHRSLRRRRHLRRRAWRRDRRPARGRPFLDRTPGRGRRSLRDHGAPFEPSRWLNDGDEVAVGNLTSTSATARAYARPHCLPQRGNRSWR